MQLILKTYKYFWNVRDYIFGVTNISKLYKMKDLGSELVLV